MFKIALYGSRGDVQNVNSMRACYWTCGKGLTKITEFTFILSKFVCQTIRP